MDILIYLRKYAIGVSILLRTTLTPIYFAAVGHFLMAYREKCYWLIDTTNLLKGK